MRRIVACLVTLVLAGALVSGCKSIGGSGGSSNNGGIGGTGGGVGGLGGANPVAKVSTTSAKGGCAQAGPLTSGELAGLSVEGYSIIDNPCIPAVGLIDQVLDLIPADPQQEEKVAQNVSLLRDNLGRFVNRLSQLDSVVSCAYTTDRLAVRVYHNTHAAWSVGAVAVIRGRVGAVADTVACYLISQIPLIGPFFQGVGPESDTPDFCFDTVGDKRDGQDYTIAWISDSSVLCRTFQNRLVPGHGSLVAVRANPNVALRSGPSRTDSLIRRLPDGTIGRVSCYATGESVNGDNLWARVNILGNIGFVVDAYLTNNNPTPPTPDSSCQSS